jgi:tricorn protease-like protein
VVYSDRDGNIYRVSVQGGPAEKICAGCGTTVAISTDGSRVIYEPLTGDDLGVLDLRTQAKYTPMSPVKDTILAGAQFSPDGKWIAFDARTVNSTAQIFVVPAVEARTVPQPEWIAITPGQSEDIEPAWSPNGGLLYFLSDRDGFRCIWARALDPAAKAVKGEAFAVQHFHSARRSLRRILGNGGFPGLSAIPGRLVFSFGELTGNIWLER